MPTGLAFNKVLELEPVPSCPSTNGNLNVLPLTQVLIKKIELVLADWNHEIGILHLHHIHVGLVFPK